MGNTDQETQQLLVEHNSFKEKARETREKVKLLLQLADTLVEKGHAHAPNIKQWVEEVDETYKNFSTRMDKYREKVRVCWKYLSQDAENSCIFQLSNNFELQEVWNFLCFQVS